LSQKYTGGPYAGYGDRDQVGLSGRIEAARKQRALAGDHVLVAASVRSFVRVCGPVGHGKVRGPLMRTRNLSVEPPWRFELQTYALRDPLAVGYRRLPLRVR
jgi:hypothetical protein